MFHNCWNKSKGGNSHWISEMPDRKSQTDSKTETKIVKMSDDPRKSMGNYLFYQALHFNGVNTGQWDIQYLHVQMNEWSHSTVNALSTIIKLLWSRFQKFPTTYFPYFHLCKGLLEVQLIWKHFSAIVLSIERNKFKVSFLISRLSLTFLKNRYFPTFSSICDNHGHIES